MKQNKLSYNIIFNVRARSCVRAHRLYLNLFFLFCSFFYTCKYVDDLYASVLDGGGEPDKNGNHPSCACGKPAPTLLLLKTKHSYVPCIVNFRLYFNL